MPQTTITYNQIKKLAGDTTVVIMASALTFISSKYIMSEAMDNPELGNLFGIGCVSSVTTLAVTWDPGEKIVKFLRDKAKQTQYSNVINLSLPILNIALQSGIALMAFAVPILIMGENPDTSAMDIAYVFPILLLIVGLRTLAELSSNSHVRKMGDITAEAILSLIAGFLVQTTEGGLHDCL